MRFLLVALLCALSYAQTVAQEGECACVTLDPALGFGDYGSSCNNWDAQPGGPFEEDCTADGVDYCGTESWCLIEWCYVPEDCPGRVPSSLDALDGYYYSYENCGHIDCFTDPANTVGCPYVSEDADCDCPNVCIDAWIGDNFCDDANSGTDCSLCDHFTDDNGVFDGGDCERQSTTEDPDAIDHNPVIIDGESDCSDANGICESTSFRAIELGNTIDPSDTSDFDCLFRDGGASNIIESPSWFVFQVDQGGLLELDVLGDSDIDFIVWGPYDSKADAIATCGNLQNPVSCSDSGTSRETLRIDNAESGKVYVLMVSDYASQFNSFGTTVTIRSSENSVATLDCAILADDTEECVAQEQININFSEAEVVRANLAQLNLGTSEPTGTYYSKVGTFKWQQMGLLVTTSTPESYRCVREPGKNRCAEALSNTEGTNRVGKINMKAGRVVLNFQYMYDNDNDGNGVDGTSLATGEQIDSLRMTILDMDSGFARGETVELQQVSRVCPGGLTADEDGLFLSPNDGNVLDFSLNNDEYRWNVNTGCYDSRTDPPTGTFIVEQLDDDPPNVPNPDNFDILTQQQLGVSVAAEFRDVTSEGFNIAFVVNKNHNTGRNIWFAGESAQIGRICCRQIVECSNGYVNGNLECKQDLSDCTEARCCLPTTTSHGDPIIWTFHNECYDLNVDGNYLASSHPAHPHNVHVAVYNDYMRQISVTKENGDLWLAINNLGEIINNDFPYRLEQKVVPCPEDYEKDDCHGEYIVTRFDAQDFAWVIHSGLRHNYADPGVKQGEYGYHLDIYPEPYNKVFNSRRNEYTGLYFHNPLPQELGTCNDRQSDI